VMEVGLVTVVEELSYFSKISPTPLFLKNALDKLNDIVLDGFSFRGDWILGEKEALLLDGPGSMFGWLIFTEEAVVVVVVVAVVVVVVVVGVEDGIDEVGVEVAVEAEDDGGLKKFWSIIREGLLELDFLVLFQF